MSLVMVNSIERLTMSHYQKFLIVVMFLMLCSYSMMIGHGVGLLGLLILPLLAFACVLIVKLLIDEIDGKHHHQSRR
jgi:hypothetical protein